MRFKEGVPNDTLEPEILAGAKILDAIFTEKLEMMITSTTDGKHMKKSLHYNGQAVDIRILTLSSAMIHDIFVEAKKRLGKNFDLVIEQNHFHLEYDPKKEKQ